MTKKKLKLKLTEYYKATKAEIKGSSLETKDQGVAQYFIPDFDKVNGNLNNSISDADAEFDENQSLQSLRNSFSIKHELKESDSEIEDYNNFNKLPHADSENNNSDNFSMKPDVSNLFRYQGRHSRAQKKFLSLFVLLILIGSGIGAGLGACDQYDVIKHFSIANTIGKISLDGFNPVQRGSLIGAGSSFLILLLVVLILKCCEKTDSFKNNTPGNNYPPNYCLLR